jgi:glycosyltransferase involved in cell wall biosynthesis
MTSSEAGLAVVIPALNEEATIAATVAAVRIRGLDAIVVDDGSTDCTAEVAAAEGAQVIRHERNFGYEPALSTGVHAAAAAGYGMAVTFDADGQLDADDLVRFVEIIRREDSDVVIGVRDHRNRISENLLAWYGRWRFGIRDPLCGMKLYRLASARLHFPFDQAGLVGMELAFRMAAGGCRISEAAIHVVPRRGDSRYGNSLRGNLKILRALLRSARIFGWVRRAPT